LEDEEREPERGRRVDEKHEAAERVGWLVERVEDEHHDAREPETRRVAPERWEARGRGMEQEKIFSGKEYDKFGDYDRKKHEHPAVVAHLFYRFGCHVHGNNRARERERQPEPLVYRCREQHQEYRLKHQEAREAGYRMAEAEFFSRHTAPV